MNMSSEPHRVDYDFFPWWLSIALLILDFIPSTSKYQLPGNNQNKCLLRAALVLEDGPGQYTTLYQGYIECTRFTHVFAHQVGIRLAFAPRNVTLYMYRFSLTLSLIHI